MTTTSTPNYSLVKPTPGTAEPVSVQTHLDDNWDKIDQDMNRYDKQVFTTSGTWNKPARCKRVEVEVQGNGGTGGGAAAAAGGNGAIGSGGGGGGYAKKLFLASALASSETVTVPAAATGATPGNNNGNAGGAVIFAATKGYAVTANGGAAGTGGASAGAFAVVAGGAGGTASGGDINIQGGNGGAGCNSLGNPLPFNKGGDAQLGKGGQPSEAADGAGVAPGLYGGGSAGGYVKAGAGAARGSQNAAPGVVIVYNYY